MAMKLPPNIAKIANELSDKNKEQARSIANPTGSTAATRSLPTNKRLQADAYDYFTVPGDTQLFYSAEEWVQISIILRTVGPVAIGNRGTLTPVQSGKGTVLVTNEPLTMKLEKGTRLYVASEAVSRLSVIIIPIPATSEVGLERETLNQLMELNANIKALAARGAR